MSESREAILRDRFYHPGEFTWLHVATRNGRAWGTEGTHAQDVAYMYLAKDAILNTPATANAGRPGQMGSACFVLPINDSLTDGPASIMQTLKDAAAVHKSGGGTGFDFSRIRAKGSLVSSTGRGAPGPVSMLWLYSDGIARVTQAGMRKGANMGILRVDHPDILEFISAKKNEGDLANFNISVALTDEFMLKVTGGTLNHHEQVIWDSIVHRAWDNGEPGVFFVDTTNRLSLHPEWIESTNPCGEVPLRPYEACVLGSINLANHLTPRGNVNYTKLRHTTHVLTEALDNVITRQSYPIPEIEREQKRYRKIGVGMMGLADVFCELGVKYGSPESIEVAEEFAHAIQGFSYDASEALAKERGTYDGRTPDMPWRRNLNVQVVAPTGTISRLAECSFGIEPHFDVDESGNYWSFVVGGQFLDHNPYHKNPAFTPASEVTVDQHLAIQAAVQKHVDQAVSKTVNAPFETTVDDIERLYVRAWETGCKGVTVLRQGSREESVIVAPQGDCVGAACSLPKAS